MPGAAKAGESAEHLVVKKKKQIHTVQTPGRFVAGAQVRVKPGTTVPDYPDIPPGDGAATSREVDQWSDQPTCLIEWNQHTPRLPQAVRAGRTGTRKRVAGRGRHRASDEDRHPPLRREEPGRPCADGAGAEQ